MGCARGHGHDFILNEVFFLRVLPLDRVPLGIAIERHGALSIGIVPPQDGVGWDGASICLIYPKWPTNRRSAPRFYVAVKRSDLPPDPLHSTHRGDRRHRLGHAGEPETA